MAIADFDGDGDSDLAINSGPSSASLHPRYARILLNQAIPPISSDCDFNGVPDECEADADLDGAIDACDLCPGEDDRLDIDQDLVPDCLDNCPQAANMDQGDRDSDLRGDACDDCPDNAGKVLAGTCGCALPDVDFDRDGTLGCFDPCDLDPLKIEPGICGCGSPDVDTDGDSVLDCEDRCPQDPEKTSPGVCGCGVSDADLDGDDVPDCVPNTPKPTASTATPTPTATSEPPRTPVSFVVDTERDTVDVAPGDGACADILGTCSLRAAIQEANVLLGLDRIVLPSRIYQLALPGDQEDAGATGDLDVIDDLEIRAEGESPVIIDGGAIDRILEVQPNCRLAISGVTLRNGFDRARSRAAGAVTNGGRLSMSDCVLADNVGGETPSSSGAGALWNQGAASLMRTKIVRNRGGAAGGIVNRGEILIKDGEISDSAGTPSSNAGALSSTGTARLIRTVMRHHGTGSVAVFAGAGRLEMTDCEISETYISAALQVGETAHVVGLRTDIVNSDRFIENDGTLELTDSQAHGFSATTPLHGITNRGTMILRRVAVQEGSRGIENRGELTMVNCTVADGGLGIYNLGEAYLDGVTVVGNGATSTFESGGITNEAGGVVVMRSSILAGNRDDSGEGPDCRGAIESRGHNLIQDVAGCEIFGMTDEDFLGADPMLGPLQDNGGHGATLLPLAGSPVVDKVPAAECLPVDQRGVPRPYGVRCDIGAVELNSTCGNGEIEYPESCDDGNLVAGDCCSPLCQFEPELLSGDASCDGDVTAADLTSLMSLLASGTTTPCGREDANGDCSFDAADIDAAVQALFLFPG